MAHVHAAANVECRTPVVTSLVTSLDSTRTGSLKRAAADEVVERPDEGICFGERTQMAEYVATLLCWRQDVRSLGALNSD